MMNQGETDAGWSIDNRAQRAAAAFSSLAHHPSFPPCGFQPATMIATWAARAAARNIIRHRVNRPCLVSVRSIYISGVVLPLFVLSPPILNRLIVYRANRVNLFIRDSFFQHAFQYDTKQLQRSYLYRFLPIALLKLAFLHFFFHSLLPSNVAKYTLHRFWVQCDLGFILSG